MVKDSAEQAQGMNDLNKKQCKRKADALYRQRKKAGLVKPKAMVAGLITVGAGASLAQMNSARCKNYRQR